ncbi:putative amidohydrolase YtcJ [Amphiura filiformis]|uniref:putative amidohydrolase YtcJ n=1 Tax=Amphiura filiformis TaxID=82378 RepID=UPI003B20D7CA
MADTILYGGDIITMDDKLNRAGKVEAIAIAGGIIVEVGSMKRVFRRKGPNTEVIFLNQQTLMPGFIEPHQHALQTSQMRCLYTNISALNFSCYAEIRQKMLDTLDSIKKDPAGADKWALFFGWDPELIADLPPLTAKFLDDEFAADVPIAVVGQSGHVAWANTLAFQESGIDVNDVNVEAEKGGVFVKDEDGHLTGQMFEEPAIMGVMGNAPMPTGEMILAGIVDQMRYYASVGITTVTDLAYMPNEDFDNALKSVFDKEDTPVRLGLYRMEHPHKEDPSASGPPSAKKARTARATKPKPTLEGKVSCCTNLGTAQMAQKKKQKQAQPPRQVARSQARSAAPEEDDEPIPIGNYNSKLWEVGIKFVADGSPHCGTCAVREPFMNTPLTQNLGFPPAPGYGTLNFTSEEFVDSMKRLTKEGTQVAVHAHGERACEQVLRAYETILADDPTNRCRHRMEHLGLMTVDQIARAGKINVALSFFVDHLRFYAKVYKTDIFGDRVNRWTPISEASKNGITWTIHQDHPTFPGDANPFANMKTAITRTQRDDPTTVYGPEYCATIDEVLKSYTINAAWQLHLDNQLGSITVGKQADLVVLTENPYHVDPFKLEDIKVVETFLSGRRSNIGKMSTVGPGLNVMKRDAAYDKA